MSPASFKTIKKVSYIRQYVISLFAVNRMLFELRNMLLFSDRALTSYFCWIYMALPEITNYIINGLSR